jgi:hypothetical protein
MPVYLVTQIASTFRNTKIITTLAEGENESSIKNEFLDRLRAKYNPSNGWGGYKVGLQEVSKEKLLTLAKSAK